MFPPLLLWKNIFWASLLRGYLMSFGGKDTLARHSLPFDPTLNVLISTVLFQFSSFDDIYVNIVTKPNQTKQTKPTNQTNNKKNQQTMRPLPTILISHQIFMILSLYIKLYCLLVQHWLLWQWVLSTVLEEKWIKVLLYVTLDYKNFCTWLLQPGSEIIYLCYQMLNSLMVPRHLTLELNKLTTR